MTGKLIAQKLEPRKSARLIQQRDGNAIFWVCFAGRSEKQTVLSIRKEEIDETIRALGLKPVQHV
jgi:hypothetical protein